MAKAHSRLATFSLDNSGGTPVDVTQYVDTVSLQDAVDASETTTLGDNAREYIEGLAGTTISVSGPLDSVLYAQIAGIRQSGATRTFTYRPMGGTGTYPTISGECLVSAFTLGAQVGNPASFSATLTVTGAVTYGTI
jgi:hypothetical protein